MAAQEFELELATPTEQDGIELHPETEAAGDNPHVSTQEFTLPPVDGGKDAWLFLAACFMLDGLVWGFPFAFGIFQDYYSNHPPFKGSPNIAIIGTCAMGIMYIAPPLIFGGMRTFQRSARWAPLTGLVLMCTSLALSSFCTTTTQLIATQGVLYGIGGGLSSSSCPFYLDEWFVRRKGLAYGILFSGTAVSGVILPLLMEFLLGKYGHETTLRLWSGVVFVLTVPLSFFIKPRSPVSATVIARPFDWHFLFHPVFLLYQIPNILEGLGYFLPTIYLPTYARTAFGLSSLSSAVTILLVNIASVFGSIVMGWFIDRFHVTTCIMVSTIGTAVGVFCVWGLSVSVPVLYFFCVIYGLFAGSFTSSYSGVMKEVASRIAMDPNHQRQVDPLMVFGWLSAGRGIGNIISGPLSESLTSGMPWEGGAGFVYGSGYGPLIVFTGVTALLGGSSFVWRKCGVL